MFAVMSSIKKTLPLSDRTLEILLIQEGHEGYAGEMSHIPNCNIYSYHNNLDKRLKANLPTNMFIINDLDSIITNSFDYIVCIGRTNSAAIANELKRRFSCPMILVDDAADSTYCIRPFGIPLNNRINVDFDKNISLNKYINKNIPSIPYIRKENKVYDEIGGEPKFCLSSSLHPSALARYKGVLNGLDYKYLSEDTISESNIFIETHVGITSSLIGALEYGCFVVCPYSEEVELMIGNNENLGFIYNDLVELRQHIQHLKSLKQLPKRSNYLLKQITSTYKEFQKAWNTILRNI